MAEITNIFLVHTEYHLLQAVNIILEKYSSEENHIYMTENKRIKKNLKIDKDNIHFYYIQASNYGEKLFLKQLLDKGPTNFFFFQEVSSDNMYLSYWMHRNGVKIVLLQDGLKPYVQWNRKYMFAHIILETFRIYKEMIKRKAVIHCFFLINLFNYGEWSFIDEIWLSTPDKFVNTNKKILNKTPEFSDKSLETINKLFQTESYAIDKTAVLIIGQPALQEYWKRDVEILAEIVKKFPNRKVIYKPHPNTKAKHMKLISEVEGLEVINYQIPVELLMLIMKDTCIISSYSTASLTYNPTCKFYWTHKLFGGGTLFSQLNVVNPTDHIVEVSSIDDITL